MPDKPSLRQWRQRTRQQQLDDILQRLALELEMGTARRHLDLYLTHAEMLLDGLTATQDGTVQRARQELGRLRERVERRGMAVANDNVN